MRNFILISGMILALSATASGETYVVNPEGTGDFPTIQAAIDAVVDGDIIELTDGTFTGNGNRDINFLGKAITVRSQSGNPEACVINPEGVGDDPHPGFILTSGEGPESVLEGVTITNGHGLLLDTGWTAGGGMYCENSSPRITNCIFCRNHAHRGAGLYCKASSPALTNCTFSHNSGNGMFCTDGSAPTIAECIFLSNHLDRAGGGLLCDRHSPATVINCRFSNNVVGNEGGGVACVENTSSFTNCIFENNWAGYEGGGVTCHEPGAVTFTNCTFSGNSAVVWGGGLYSFWSSPYLTNCTFSGNSAGGGGGLYCYRSSPHLTNCTFYSNSAYYGGGGIGGVAHGPGPLILSQTIIAFSTSGEAILYGDYISLDCCDLYGNAGGDWTGSIAGQYGINGNIAEDPLFCDPANGDFRLHEDSPCAPFSPPNPECDLIGAWPVGCGPAGVGEPGPRPSMLYLAPPAPNPFATTTCITYQVPPWASALAVHLSICDLSGRPIRTWPDMPMAPGLYSIRWDGTDNLGIPLPGGIYFCRLGQGGQNLSKRIVLLH